MGYAGGEFIGRGYQVGAATGRIPGSAAVGGPLAIVKDGDMIELNVSERQLELLVPGREIKSRLEMWRPSKAHFARGYGRMYLEHVLQAHEGCDFDYLRG